MTRLTIKCMLFVVSVVALISLAGCAQDPYLYKGAGLGGALGAGIGAAVNGSNPWKGAAIGGLLGLAAGGVAGEAYGQSLPPSQTRQGYNQYGPQQPYNRYPPPNQGYNQGPYGRPSYSQSGPPPSYPPGNYSQEGAPEPYWSSQGPSDPSYRHDY
jgi:hypothetical protein